MNNHSGKKFTQSVTKGLGQNKVHVLLKSIRLISCMHNQADGNLSTTLLTAVHDNLSTTLLKLEGEVDDKLYY